MQATSQTLVNAGIRKPVQLLDVGRAQRNINRMAKRADLHRVNFRPHFKTHQSGAIGRWFNDAGVTKITVSSLDMAMYFAEFDWIDITLAFVLNPNELARVRELAVYLAGKQGRLGVVVDSPYTAAKLVEDPDLPLDVWLKIDTGHGRTGLVWNRMQDIAETWQILSQRLKPAGLLTHAGHAYQAKSKEDLVQIFSETCGRMQTIGRHLLEVAQALREPPRISIGDTPCCSIVDDFAGCNEIRPGNFVFYDLMQLNMDVCTEDDLAMAVACPIVGLYPERNEVVLHGGAVHLSKERLTLDDGRQIYGSLGTLVPGTDKRGPQLGRVIHEAPVVSLTQEHGIVRCADGQFETLFGELNPGDVALVYPVHACLTANLHRKYHTLSGLTLSRM